VVRLKSRQAHVAVQSWTPGETSIAKCRGQDDVFGCFAPDILLQSKT